MKQFNYVRGGIALAITLLWNASPAWGAFLEEKFTSVPDRWHIVGDANLFQWNQARAQLDVTWDSARSNSYFALPLGTTLTRQDDFWVSFELTLADATAGVNPGKPNPFQISVGLVNLAEASRPGFIRGTGADSPDLVEFSYFPDPGGEWMWGPSLTSMLSDSTGTNWSLGGFSPLALETGAVYRVTLTFTAQDQKLRTTITRAGLPFLQIDPAQPSAAFTDFQVDHLAVLSYSELGQDPAYSGSILAHGTIDNVSITLPSPPVQMVTGSFQNGVWQVRFTGKTNWLYRLFRTTDMDVWAPVSSPLEGTGSVQVLEDSAPPAQGAFYRVEAKRR